MFYKQIYIKLIRQWQAKHNLCAFFISSKAEHTEVAVILDNKGYAYQISNVYIGGVLGRSSILISAYTPHTMKVHKQVELHSYIFALPYHLKIAFDAVTNFIIENSGERVPEEHEINEVKQMYERGVDFIKMTECQNQSNLPTS